MNVESLEENIGKKCRKRPINDKNIGKYKLKPFKSGLKVNTIAGVINHPKLEGRMAYIFEEDESYVECRRCEIIESKLNIKTKDEIINSEPIKPENFFEKSFLSNLLYFSTILSPFYLVFLLLLIFDLYSFVGAFFIVIILTTMLFSLFLIDNMGPLFTDKIFKIYFYKKRKRIWNKWWNQTAMSSNYLNIN